MKLTFLNFPFRTFIYYSYNIRAMIVKHGDKSVMRSNRPPIFTKDSQFALNYKKGIEYNLQRIKEYNIEKKINNAKSIN